MKKITRAIVFVLFFAVTSRTGQAYAGDVYKASTQTAALALKDVKAAPATVAISNATSEASEKEDLDNDTALKDINIVEEALQRSHTANDSKTNELIKNELVRIMLEFGEDDEVPQVFLDEVKGYIKVFQTNTQYRRFVTASIKRSSKYMPIVKEVLNQKRIPEDMAYIAFIESGFNPNALSHAGARGMWQFMPGTAKNYSLAVNKSLDDRLDPIKSTYAAADYFHDLIAIFGPRSFLLAMAAYNSGEGRVISCLKGIENPFEERNFWHIRPCLSKETREYPPKIIAASIIGNNPEAFGFPKMKPEQAISEELSDRADYRGGSAKPTLAVYKETPKASALTSGMSMNKVSRGNENCGKVFSILYTVKRGNRLDRIADIFEVAPSDIKKWNKMKDGNLIAGQKLKLYSSKRYEAITYKIKKDDTLTALSEALGVRPGSIISSNGLRNGISLKTGQTLTIYAPAGKKPVIHIVKKGTNLRHISEKYNVSVKNIMLWNNLANTNIGAGRKLKIYKNNTEEA